jgi:hypothetical protein
MTLEDADQIVRQYALVLERGRPDGGPADYESRLPHPRDRIMQAMKLVLAHSVEDHSLTEELRNQICTAAGYLPFFVEDAEARRINAIRRKYEEARKRQDLPAREFIALAETDGETHEFWSRAFEGGASLRGELNEFVKAVAQLDPEDPIYRQRVHALAGVEYSPAKRRSFWGRFS